MTETKVPAAKPAEDADEARRKDADDARRKTEDYQQQAPTETETHGMERAPERASLSEDIHARVARPHKGEVGRPGTNEEIFQGSKQKQLND